MGVELIGLGALTASVTNGGQWITQQPEVRASITHGDAYTVAVAEQGIEQIIELCRPQSREARIAIVGAYGLIGQALSMIFAKKGCQLVLVGRSRNKLERLKEKLGTENNILTSIELEAIYDADIVVTVTSHSENLIKPEHLRRSAVVYDIAQPRNISPAFVRECADIIKVDGACVHIGGIKLGFDMGPPPNTTFACLAETIMQALEEDGCHHVGEIDFAHVERTREWALKHNFSHAPFTCFSQPIPTERFEEIFRLRQEEN